MRGSRQIYGAVIAPRRRQSGASQRRPSVNSARREYGESSPILVMSAVDHRQQSHGLHNGRRTDLSARQTSAAIAAICRAPAVLARRVAQVALHAADRLRHFRLHRYLELLRRELIQTALHGFAHAGPVVRPMRIGVAALRPQFLRAMFRRRRGSSPSGCCLAAFQRSQAASSRCLTHSIPLIGACKVSVGRMVTPMMHRENHAKTCGCKA